MVAWPERQRWVACGRGGNIQAARVIFWEVEVAVVVEVVVSWGITLPV